MAAQPTAPDEAPLTPEEVEEARAKFKADLADEHVERVEKVKRRQARTGGERSKWEQEARNAALNALKADVQAQFYRDNGYKVYTDSTGRQHWLTVEEYEHRMTRRRRRHEVFEPVVGDRTRNIIFMVGLVLLAVVMGFALAR